MASVQNLEILDTVSFWVQLSKVGDALKPLSNSVFLGTP